MKKLFDNYKNRIIYAIHFYERRKQFIGAREIVPCGYNRKTRWFKLYLLK